MAFARKVMTGTAAAILGAVLAFAAPAQAAQFTLDADVPFDTGGASPAIGTLLPIIDPVGSRICLASCSNIGLSDFDSITDPNFFQPGAPGAGGRDVFIFQIDLDSGTLQSIGVAMQEQGLNYEVMGFFDDVGLVAPKAEGALSNGGNPVFDFFPPSGDFSGNETSVRLFVTYAPNSLPPAGINLPPFLVVPPDTVRFMINDGVGLVDFEGTVVAPEPVTGAMIGLGLLALIGTYRRRS